MWVQWLYEVLMAIPYFFDLFLLKKKKKKKWGLYD